MKMRLTVFKFTYKRDLNTISYLLDGCSDVTLDAPLPFPSLQLQNVQSF